MLECLLKKCFFINDINNCKTIQMSSGVYSAVWIHVPLACYQIKKLSNPVTDQRFVAAFSVYTFISLHWSYVSNTNFIWLFIDSIHIAKFDTSDKNRVYCFIVMTLKKKNLYLLLYIFNKSLVMFLCLICLKTLYIELK